LVIKDGGHRLFEEEEKTSRYVAQMLRQLRTRGIDAVCEYSREFDDWDPPDFELSPREIDEAIGRCGDQVVADTAFCQGNVRAFAEAQLATLIPLETEIRPGVVLGHKHIPVSCVGSYVPGGRYPMFGSAQMSIIPAKVAGVRPGDTVTVVGDGAVGLLAVLSAKQLGAEQVVLMGRHTARTDLGREYGATDVVAERGQEGIEKVRELTGGGSRVVLEAVGHMPAYEQSYGVVRAGGVISRVGVPQYDEAPVGFMSLFGRNITLNGGPAPTRAYMAELLPAVLDGTVDPGRVFDRTIGLEDVPEGYRAMDAREALKVLITP
ncbi:histidinol dehydrogenase, partial [uncultured Nocardioides sp.]|uniref:histidinol dehydrogenase n=1 Tax=uncultured Nocardioides sp. TaxID=198441 RepID=UPI00262720CD